MILLLVCGTVAAQTPQLPKAHDHQNPSRHCCGLCYVGPLPVLTSAGTLLTAPDLPLVWLTPAEDNVRSHDSAFTHTSSRAPPL